jgi:hypothetical protein
MSISSRIRAKEFSQTQIVIYRRLEIFSSGRGFGRSAAVILDIA